MFDSSYHIRSSLWDVTMISQNNTKFLYPTSNRLYHERDVSVTENELLVCDRGRDDEGKI